MEPAHGQFNECTKKKKVQVSMIFALLKSKKSVFSLLKTTKNGRR